MLQANAIFYLSLHKHWSHLKEHIVLKEKNKNFYKTDQFVRKKIVLVDKMVLAMRKQQKYLYKLHMFVEKIGDTLNELRHQPRTMFASQQHLRQQRQNTFGKWKLQK